VLAIGMRIRDNHGHVVFWGDGVVTLGLAPRQADLMKGTASFVGARVKDDSIWAVLHRECHVLFPDELFADLFTSTGRRDRTPRWLPARLVVCVNRTRRPITGSTNRPFTVSRLPGRRRAGSMQQCHLESYLLPQLGLFEIATTNEHVADEGSPERKQLRQGIFHANAWDHWCAAVRAPQAPRGAQTPVATPAAAAGPRFS
jgi:hypothetical protein